MCHFLLLLDDYAWLANIPNEVETFVKPWIFPLFKSSLPDHIAGRSMTPMDTLASKTMLSEYFRDFAPSFVIILALTFMSDWFMTYPDQPKKPFRGSTPWIHIIGKAVTSLPVGVSVAIPTKAHNCCVAFVNQTFQDTTGYNRNDVCLGEFPLWSSGDRALSSPGRL